MLNTSTGTIDYIYDANGIKLAKVVTTGGNTNTTYYTAIGNYTKLNGNAKVLDFIFTSEGRLVGSSDIWRYEYYYKDHLNNTRLGFSDYDESGSVHASEITQQQNYYPYGLEHKGTDYGVATQTTHKYKFQGQEHQEELGLGWISFKWRNHNPEIGRFINIDPLAEKYYYNSTYAFQENKIGLGLELEGLELAPSPFSVNPYYVYNLTASKGNKYSHAEIKTINEGNLKAIQQGGPKAAKIIAIGSAMLLAPEIGFPLAVTDLTHVPVTPSPAAMTKTVTSNVAQSFFAEQKTAAGFSVAESSIIDEGLNILGSKAFNQIREAYAAGEAVEVSIGGRTILYEPDLPASGFTLFDEGAFVMGPEAFSSEKELTSTIMHELYRLNNSSVPQAGRAAQEIATSETKKAADFAEKAINMIYER